MRFYTLLENLNKKNSLIHLSTAYFPNIQYLSKFFCNESVCIEAFENFQKQSFRNRCELQSANGVIKIFAPVIGGKDQKTLIRDVKIDYTSDWQKQHFKSIESAYNSSPFYEYIIEDFMFVFEKKERFLFDLNIKILEQVKEYLQINSKIKLTPTFQLSVEQDFRNSIHPKAKMQKTDSMFCAKKYYQTFNDRFEFFPNLSILDLLFNEGPRASSIIRESIR